MDEQIALDVGEVTRSRMRRVDTETRTAGPAKLLESAAGCVRCATEGRQRAHELVFLIHGLCYCPEHVSADVRNSF